MAIKPIARLLHTDNPLNGERLEFKDEELTQFCSKKLADMQKKGLSENVSTFLSNVNIACNLSVLSSSVKMKSLEEITSLGCLRITTEICLKYFSLRSFWVRNSCKNEDFLKKFIMYSSNLNAAGAESIAPKIGYDAYRKVDQIHRQLMCLAAEKLVEIHNFESRLYAALPVPSKQPDDVKRRILLYCKSGTWFPQLFIQRPNEFSYPIRLVEKISQPIRFNGTLEFFDRSAQVMLFDEDFLPIRDSHLAVKIAWDDSHPNYANLSEAMNLLTGFLDGLSSISNLPPISIVLSLYSEWPKLDSQQRNAIQFEVGVDPKTLEVVEKHLICSISSVTPIEGLTEIQLETLTKKALSIVETFKEQWREELVDSKLPAKNIDIFWPRSQLDWKEIQWRMCLELCKDPEGNVEMIEWLTDELDLTFPEEDFRLIASKEQLLAFGNEKEVDLVLSPEQLASGITKQAENDYQQVYQEEIANSNFAVENAPILKQNKKKAFSRKEKHPKQKINESSKNSQSAPKLELSSREREQVKHVMQGNPMKADAFVKLALNLLKKKKETSKATLQENQRGAHPTFHLTKASGQKSGITLSIAHGRKEMSVTSQKRTLKDLLRF
jgi:hypothetical protein